MDPTEPILDFFRACSTVAAFQIMGTQVANLYHTFFSDLCRHCRGTGIVTCPLCHGTATLRSEPGYVRERSASIVADFRAPATYPCYRCGPHDLMEELPGDSDDDEPWWERMEEIKENLESAMTNTFPLPHSVGPLAGTVECPACLGDPEVNLMVPNFLKAFGLERPWDTDIAQRRGERHMPNTRPSGRRYDYTEYPAGVPRPMEMYGTVPDNYVDLNTDWFGERLDPSTPELRDQLDNMRRRRRGLHWVDVNVDSAFAHFENPTVGYGRSRGEGTARPAAPWKAVQKVRRHARRRR